MIALLVSLPLIALIAWGVAALWHYGKHVEPNRVEITRHEVWFDDLPASLDGVVLCQVADVHITDFGRNERAIAEAIRSVEADLYLLTGDQVYQRGGVGAFFRWMDELGEAIRPCVAVYGNAEHKRDIPTLAMTREYARRDIPLLNNDSGIFAVRGAEMQIVGVDDPHMGKSNFARAYRSADAGRWTLLLCHSPDGCAERRGHRADLMLCGHTHGGQCRLPLIGALRTNTYRVRRIVSGWYRGEELTWRGKSPAGNTQLYVSRGLGMSKFPLRIHCPPELALFVLRRRNLSANAAAEETKARHAI